MSRCASRTFFKSGGTTLFVFPCFEDRDMGVGRPRPARIAADAWPIWWPTQSGRQLSVPRARDFRGFLGNWGCSALLTADSSEQERLKGRSKRKWARAMFPHGFAACGLQRPVPSTPRLAACGRGAVRIQPEPARLRLGRPEQHNQAPKTGLLLRRDVEPEPGWAPGPGNLHDAVRSQTARQVDGGLPLPVPGGRSLSRVLTRRRSCNPIWNIQYLCLS